MDWTTVLTQKPLQDKAEGLLKAVLLGHLPPFVAPTDPAAWQQAGPRLRQRALAEVFLKGFPAGIAEQPARVVWGRTLRPDPSYVIRKLRYEIYPDYWIPGLLYEPTQCRGRIPVVLNPNGHHAGGKAIDYKQIRCANLARRGILALNLEFIGMGELRADACHNNIAMLNVTGLAGVGLFYLALSKGLDLLLAHPNADSSRVGVTGLSGGGWQTIVAAALDERVTLCVPVAGYTSCRARVGCRNDIGDLEQVPVDLTTVLDYQEMTALLAPRPLLQILNADDDCCFKTERAKPVIYEALLPTYRAFGAVDRIDVYSNTDPGTHNYGADNRQAFYRFIAKHWGLAGPSTDLKRTDEVLPESELRVGLPQRQETLQHLATTRARRLAAHLRTPQTPAARRRLRRALVDVIRLPQYAATAAQPAPGDSTDGTTVLCCGPWAVPVSLRRGAAAGPVTLILADAGRAQSAQARSERPGSLIVADILGTGENAANWQLLMLLETVGLRLLGEQVAQVLACARYAATTLEAARLEVVGDGQVAAVVALLAAALEPELFSRVTAHGTVASLVHLIEGAERYENSPSLFCFGLLEVADIPQMVALLEDVLYEQPARAVPAVQT
jgi:dienelactone hydrolase